MIFEQPVRWQVWSTGTFVPSAGPFEFEQTIIVHQAEKGGGGNRRSGKLGRKLIKKLLKSVSIKSQRCASDGAT